MTLADFEVGDLDVRATCKDVHFGLTVTLLLMLLSHGGITKL
jgi:hypothetical protein